MRARNNFMLIGNLGKAPELKIGERSKKPIVKFSVAVNRVYLNDCGEKQQQTEWFPIVVLRERLCQICMEYLHKGSEITVIGHLHRNVWESNTRKNANGNPMMESRIELIMDELVMHGSARRQENSDEVLDTVEDEDIPF